MTALVERINALTVLAFMQAVQIHNQQILLDRSTDELNNCAGVINMLRTGETK